MYDLVVDQKSRVAGNYSISGGKVVWNPIIRRNLHDWEIPRVIDLLARLQNMKVNHRVEDKRIWTRVESSR